ncbi:MAG TPA: hypothetical protein PKD54_05430 [Pirellulaceae bacterium]|nr:hypothetical protein [Pirellulaceae bacterium]
MNRSDGQWSWAFPILAVGWCLTSLVGTWLLLPFAAHPQYALVPWLPLVILLLALWRWPWRSAWRWSVDGWSAIWLICAVLSVGLTIYFAEPLLITVASLLLALVICRGVVANNRWPLAGVWLPLVLPLSMLFGFDARLTRLHDRLVYEQNLTLMDTLAVPNDGFKTMPTEDIQQSYWMDYSGNPWSSWGNLVGMSLIIAVVFRRRGLHGLALASSGFVWAVILNVLHTIGPFAARRFAGSMVREPLLTSDSMPYILIGAFVLVLSADQFFRFALGEVESDEDNVSLSGRVAKLWNRLTSLQLTPRQSYHLRRAQAQPGLALICVGLVVALSVVAGIRMGGFFSREFPTFSGDIPRDQLKTSDERFLIGEGTFERLAPGSRLGTRVWTWTVGGQLGHAVVVVDESPTAQRDLMHQIRFKGWRMTHSEDFQLESRSPQYEWTSVRLDKSLDETYDVRHRGLLLVAMTRSASESQKQPLTLVGRFPTWSGQPWVGTRWDGKLQRGSITIWLMADNFQEYTEEEIAAWEKLFVQFVESLPTAD